MIKKNNNKRLFLHFPVSKGYVWICFFIVLTILSGLYGFYQASLHDAFYELVAFELRNGVKGAIPILHGNVLFMAPLFFWWITGISYITEIYSLSAPLISLIILLFVQSLLIYWIFRILTGRYYSLILVFANLSVYLGWILLFPPSGQQVFINTLFLYLIYRILRFHDGYIFKPYLKIYSIVFVLFLAGGFRWCFIGILMHWVFLSNSYKYRIFTLQNFSGMLFLGVLIFVYFFYAEYFVESFWISYLRNEWQTSFLFSLIHWHGFSVANHVRLVFFQFVLPTLPWSIFLIFYFKNRQYLFAHKPRRIKIFRNMFWLLLISLFFTKPETRDTQLVLVPFIFVLGFMGFRKELIYNESKLDYIYRGGILIQFVFFSIPLLFMFLPLFREIRHPFLQVSIYTVIFFSFFYVAFWYKKHRLFMLILCFLVFAFFIQNLHNPQNEKDEKAHLIRQLSHSGVLDENQSIYLASPVYGKPTTQDVLLLTIQTIRNEVIYPKYAELPGALYILQSGDIDYLRHKKIGELTYQNQDWYIVKYR